MELRGWGGYSRCESEYLQPRSLREAQSFLASGEPFIARGLGRSYGDSALADRVLGMQGLDLFRDFDPASGVLRCQAGISLDALLQTLVPRGWFLPVTPGTSQVTVGGAIASDVHGKNHHSQGCFSTCVESLLLLLADGSLVRCSRSEHTELFAATCGGMGLTGVIVEACLRLRRITSSHIHQTTYKASNLEHALELFKTHEHASYSVAWIDCLATGANLGRCLLMLGEHAEDGTLHAAPPQRIGVPFHTPAILLNRHSMALFNNLYYQRIRAAVSESRVDFRSFFYPLDAVNNWNRLYGRPGFLQYQFVLPQEAGMQGVRSILQRIADSGLGSFLAVLKAMGKANDCPLSFPIEGYSLALDFKMSSAVLTLLNDLDAMTLDFGGRLYLAKDARMTETTFKRSYPRWEAFQEVRARYGALGKFSSLQSRRLGLG